MYLNRRFITLLFIFTILIYGYQNCSMNSPVRFMSLDSTSLMSSASGAGGFDGKPAPGDYTRKFPNYSCANASEVGVQGLMKVSANIKISEDNCRSTDYLFQTGDRIVDYESYNPDYVGIGATTYERNETAVPEEPPITDMWCRFRNNTFGLDVVVKSGQNLEASTAKIYFGDRPDISATWNSKKVNSFSVARQEIGSQFKFASENFQLEVQKSSISSSLLKGQLVAKVDGSLRTLQMNCRSANKAPVEEMGIDLTPMFPINILTADSQEGVCSHSAVLACENMESRPTTQSPVTTLSSKFKLNYFAFSNSNNASILTNGNSKDGTHSLQWQFPQDEVGAGTADFDFPAQPEVFTRFYIKFSPGFVFSPVATSVAIVAGSKDHITFQFDSTGTPMLSFNGNSPIKSKQALNNIDQWHCVEMRIGPGANNTGEMNLWIDSSIQIAGTGLGLAAQSDFYYFQQWVNWGCNGGYDTNTNRCQNSSDPLNRHPNQFMYMDNFIASKQRIGCF